MELTSPLKNKTQHHLATFKMKRLTLILISLVTHICFGQSYEVEEVMLSAKIHEIEGINKSGDEFCPIVIGNEIFFTSTREFNKHTLGESLSESASYLNIFQGDLTKKTDTTFKVSSIRLLSKRIQTKNHTGPMSFSKNGDTIFFTQVKQIPGEKEYVPQLFYAIKKKDKWTQITKLPFCLNNNSYAHPTYDSNNHRLYFAAELEGGKGGKDIYYSQLIAGQWAEPKNLEEINTSADEKFPTCLSNNLYFSSDREGGEGNLDIYYVALENSNYPIKIEGLNSPYDDFGLTINPNLKDGFFSSNRHGSDDIYHFEISKSIKMKSQLAGNFSYRKVSGKPENLTVKILDENGEFVYEQRTDKYGNFLFDDILLGKDYSIQLDSTNENDLVLEFYNEHGKAIANFIVDKHGDFQYKNIFYEDRGVFKFIPENMKTKDLKKAKLSGKLLYEDDPVKALSNGVVNLVDEKRNIIQTVETDEYGNFEINDLDSEIDYFIEVPQCSEELLLYIYDAEENIFTQLKCNTMDRFMYRLLNPSSKNKLSLLVEKEDIFMLDNAEIFGRFESNEAANTNTSNIIIEAYDQAGNLLSTDTTDTKGNFRFSDLAANQELKFKASNGADLTLKLFDRFGKTVAQIQAEEEGYFSYRPVGFKSSENLALFSEDIKFSLEQLDKYDAIMLYFNTNQISIKESDQSKLVSIIKLMKEYPTLNISISAYADATASDEYNLVLSEKRGLWISQYLQKKGISKERITVNAYGESKLIDDQNDALNRRAELRFYNKQF